MYMVFEYAVLPKAFIKLIKILLLHIQVFIIFLRCIVYDVGMKVQHGIHFCIILPQSLSSFYLKQKKITKLLFYNFLQTSKTRHIMQLLYSYS